MNLNHHPLRAEITEEELAEQTLCHVPLGKTREAAISRAIEKRVREYDLLTNGRSTLRRIVGADGVVRYLDECGTVRFVEVAPSDDLAARLPNPKAEDLSLQDEPISIRSLIISSLVGGAIGVAAVAVLHHFHYFIFAN